ncbi:MFS transporter [Chitinophaga niabensis]|uniref:Predicted arabinose efflux permease, MFS family n=1 Tax=Chitinophaga niabensis TaxID=536979 RepID=A0A1N6EVQ7_9BACT|nr:MFS transporter [Chitinophaga niabensis]SIN87070.1 Predicted arabinose efflux permease, MFS family [Chitinophaga niabensis]
MFNQTLSLYKSAYGGISKPIWWLASVLLINRSGTMVIPFLTVYLTFELHFPLEQAGFTITVYGIGAIAGAVLGGKLSDKLGFYPIQFWSLVLNGVMFIVLGQMRTFPQFVVTIFILGMVGEGFRPANAAAVVHYSDESSRLRSYSLIRLAVNMGWAVGPAVGGLLASFNYRLLFWADGLTCIAAALLLRAVLKPVHGPVKKEVKKEVVKGNGSAYRDGRYIFFIILVMLNGVCLFQMFNIVPVFFKEKFLMSEAMIGLSMSVNGVAIALFEMILVYKLENKRPDVLYIGYGVIMMGFSYLLFNIFPPYVFVAFIYALSFTLAEMLTMPFMNNFWIHRSQDHNRGEYAGLYTVAYCVSTIVAPTLGAYVVRHLGYTNWWYTVAAICVLTFFGFRLLLPKRVQNVQNIQGEPH